MFQATKMSHGVMGLIFIEATMIFGVGGSVHRKQAQCAAQPGCVAPFEKYTVYVGPMRRALWVRRDLSQCFALFIPTHSRPSKLQDRLLSWISKCLLMQMDQ